MTVDIKTILRETTFRKIDVEAVLDPEHPTWIAYDPELGYVPASIVMRDGMDFSRSVYRHEADGARKIINYADRPCRINTYGDSFTQCQQVSDDETWQERLAAHYGEPIRNYGSGGYSINSACRRALRMEATDAGADYIVLNIFDDDHIRNLDAARWVRTAFNSGKKDDSLVYPLHGLPWAHWRFNVETKMWEDREALCGNGGELLALCDPENFYNTFKDDIIVKIFALQQGADIDVEELEALAEALEIEVDLKTPETRAVQAHKLHRAYGAKSSEQLLGKKMFPWAEKNGKKIIIVLSYSKGVVASYLEGKERFDQIFVDWMNANNIPFIDGLEKHKEDFAQFNCSTEDYIDRYYIKAKVAAVFGHYNPMGNMFYAFAIKDELVDRLDPKPPAYREE